MSQRANARTLIQQTSIIQHNSGHENDVRRPGMQRGCELSHLQRRPTAATSPSLTAVFKNTNSSSADACADEPIPIGELYSNTEVCRYCIYVNQSHSVHVRILECHCCISRTTARNPNHHHLGFICRVNRPDRPANSCMSFIMIITRVDRITEWDSNSRLNNQRSIFNDALQHQSLQRARCCYKR